MTNQDKTLIGILVDKSGSMSSIRSDMEGGISTFLNEQREVDGQVEVSIAEFSTEYTLVHPPTDIAEIKGYALIPTGTTALLDATGKFISYLGAQLNERDEEDRPGTVIVAIVTDGAENSSREWTRDAVKKLIESQTNDYNWEFVFLGANLDAVQEASSLGIRGSSALTYTAGGAQVGASFNSLSNYVTATRSGVRASFTDEDRKTAI